MWSLFVIRVIGVFYMLAGYSVASMYLRSGWYVGTALGSIALVGGLALLVNIRWSTYLVALSSLTVIVFLMVALVTELATVGVYGVLHTNLHSFIPGIAVMFLAIACPYLVLRHFRRREGAA